MPIFLALLSKYWKPLVGILLLAGIYFLGYTKGRNSVVLKQEKQIRIELQERYEDAERNRIRNEEVVERIDRNRKERPHDDVRDSCLLSGDPLTTRCIK